MSVAVQEHAEHRVLQWVGAYRPRGVAEESWQAAVRSFVIEAVLDLRPPGEASAKHDARDLGRLAAWAYQRGLPLDREVVLSPAVVEQHLIAWPYTDKLRPTVRSNLRRIGHRLTTRAPWEARPAALARRSVATPFSKEDIALLWRAATQQPSPGRRRSAEALVALGAGVGLNGRWNTRITGHDIREVSGIVLVDVPEPSPRTVPVLAGWEDRILALAARAKDEPLVGQASDSKNHGARLRSRILTPTGVPLLSVGRLRSSWLVEHLRIGTRLPELAAAAGLVGVTVLSDLLPYVEPLDEKSAWALLRGQP